MRDLLAQRRSTASFLRSCSADRLTNLFGMSKKDGWWQVVLLVLAALPVACRASGAWNSSGGLVSPRVWKCPKSLDRRQIRNS